MEKQGIDEILKVIDVAKGNIFSLAAIDWKLFVAQCQDLDSSEDVDVLIEVGRAIVEIIGIFGTSGLSVPLKMLVRSALKI
jgi:hypothetical protein